MAIVVCSSLILDHRYSFSLLSLQSSISYVLHSIFTHISYHYYSLFALRIPDAKQVFEKESVGWKKIEQNFIDDCPGSSFFCHVVIHGTAATILFVNPYSWHIKCHLYWGGFLTVCPSQISTVGPSSLGFVLSTSNAVYTGGGFLTVHPFQISTVGPSSLGLILSTSHAVVWYWSSSNLPQSAIWSFK